jgi:hypothetical protein
MMTHDYTNFLLSLNDESVLWLAIHGLRAKKENFTMGVGQVLTSSIPLISQDEVWKNNYKSQHLCSGSYTPSPLVGGCWADGDGNADACSSFSLEAATSSEDSRRGRRHSWTD